MMLSATLRHWRAVIGPQLLSGGLAPCKSEERWRELATVADGRRLLRGLVAADRTGGSLRGQDPYHALIRLPCVPTWRNFDLTLVHLGVEGMQHLAGVSPFSWAETERVGTATREVRGAKSNQPRGGRRANRRRTDAVRGGCDRADARHARSGEQRARRYCRRDGHGDRNRHRHRDGDRDWHRSCDGDRNRDGDRDRHRSCDGDRNRDGYGDGNRNRD